MRRPESRAYGVGVRVVRSATSEMVSRLPQRLSEEVRLSGSTPALDSYTQTQISSSAHIFRPSVRPEIHLTDQ